MWQILMRWFQPAGMTPLERHVVDSNPKSIHDIERSIREYAFSLGLHRLG